jgi:hypothetical protein
MRCRMIVKILLAIVDHLEKRRILRERKEMEKRFGRSLGTPCKFVFKHSVEYGFKDLPVNR